MSPTPPTAGTARSGPMPARKDPVPRRADRASLRHPQALVRLDPLPGAGLDQSRQGAGTDGAVLHLRQVVCPLGAEVFASRCRARATA
jgi:hypothetical protein